jgi:NitT/TauT family transport system substrate-binding protein
MSVQPAGPADEHASSGTAAAENPTASSTNAARLTRRGALALAPAVALAAGCTSKKNNNNKTTGTTKQMDQVTYLTGFLNYGREGYVHVANAKGFFREAGIEVTVKTGNGQPETLKSLIAGQAQFLTTETTLALSQMSAGVTDFRIIGAIHQRTVVAVMALTKSGISKPQDLQGKHLAYGGLTPFLLFPAYARLAGIDPKAVNWRQVPPQNLPQLLASKQVDAIGQFVTGAPLIKAAAKVDITVLPYSDYMSDMPGNLLATSSDMIKNKPDLVHRFTNAILKGLAYTIANPQESGDIIHNAVASTLAPVATAEIQAMAPYVSTNGSVVGALTPNRISQTIALMTSLGVVKEGALTPDQVCDFNFIPKES